jgi:plastocyanin
MGWNRRALLVGGVAALGLRAEAATATVVIDDFAFAPSVLRVPAGTTVVWENRDSSPHNILSRETPRTIRSPALATGESFSFIFETPGTRNYFCGLHPHMQGVVIVE